MLVSRSGCGYAGYAASFSCAQLKMYWLGRVSWSCSAEVLRIRFNVNDPFFLNAWWMCGSPQSSRSMLSLKDDVIILSTGDGDRRDKCHYQPAGDQSLTISISFKPPRGFTRGVSPIHGFRLILISAWVFPWPWRTISSAGRPNVVGRSRSQRHNSGVRP